MLNVKVFKKCTSVVFMFVIIFSGFNAKAEKIVEAKLLEIKDNYNKAFYGVDQQTEYIIYHTCFGLILNEWEDRYREIIANTPLQINQINSLNAYAEFAASVAKLQNQINALYPNIADQVALYIKTARSTGAWPQNPSDVTLQDIKIGRYNDNLFNCVKSDLYTQLENNIGEPNYLEGEQASKYKFQATWFQNSAGGVELKIEQITTGGLQLISNISGALTKISNDDYVIQQN